MKRLKDESQKDYRERRKKAQAEIKRKLKPRLVHDSFKSGTHISEKAEKKKKASFTRQLRDKRGYSEHLKQKFNKTHNHDSKITGRKDQRHISR